MNKFVQTAGITTVFAIVGVILASIPAYLTHVGVMIMMMFDSKGEPLIELMILCVGFLFPPFGIIHGWMIWFGYNVTSFV